MGIETQLKRVNKHQPLACHHQIHQIIVRAIEKGTLRAGMRLPSERELAQIAGVSRTTVRFAMQSLMHQKYIDKYSGKGIFVSDAILKRGIGCALPALNPYSKYQWPMLLTQSMVRQVLAQGYEETIYLLESPKDYRRMEQDIAQGRVHGLLTAGGLGNYQISLPDSVPVVYCNGDADRYSVNIDYYNLVYQGLEFLLKQGRRRLAVITYDAAVSSTVVSICQKAYEDVHSKHGLQVRQNWFVAGKEYKVVEERGRRAVQQLWKLRQRPDGIVFVDDWFAFSAVQWLEELGVRIPETVQVVTHLNKGYTLPFRSPITGLELDPQEMVRAAIALLEEIWTGQAPKSKAVHVPTSLLKEA